MLEKNHDPRAVTAPQPGGPAALVVSARTVPLPGANEIRIACRGMGVNRPDVLQRQGLYPPPPGASDVLGLEVSGVVEAIGDGVNRWAVGDEVCALLSGGGYADMALAHEGAVLPAPKSLSLRDAAALPETVVTVWANLFEAGRLRRGETVLIHGGTSGIGVMAIQMATAFGARVIVTAGTDEKCALCRKLGATLAINYRREDFVERVRDAGGTDVILDMVGGDYVQRNLSVLNQDGRLVQIAFLQGAEVTVNLMRLMLKRLTMTGSVLRSRPAEEKARLIAAVEAHVWPWIEEGLVQPVIDSVYSLHDVQRAHERMDSGEHAGKILLIP